MFAIAEFTIRGKFRNFAKRLIDAFACVPQLQLAHSRRIDPYSCARYNDQMTRGGSVTAAIVAFADLAGVEQLRSEDGVDERGFSDSRGAEHRRGFGNLHFFRSALCGSSF